MSHTGIIVATANLGKLREIRQMCADLPIALTSLRDHWVVVPDIAETGHTFVDNARIKARWVRQHRGGWVLADDSGLEVDALGGEPGVRSSRYAGEGASDADNLALLMTRLSGIPDTERSARFRCLMVLLGPGGSEIVTEGVCKGHISLASSGTGGFGYDPVFVPDGHTQTFAELDGPTKNAISHRGQALGSMKGRLSELLR